MIQREESADAKQIIDLITKFYDLKLEDLLGPSRKQNFAVPRQIAMYLLREELKISYPAIASAIGHRDHTTAMHAYSKIAQAIKSNKKINQEVSLIRKKIHANV